MSVPRMATSPQRELSVVAIMDTAQVSGPGRQLVALSEALATMGARVHVVTLRRTGRPQSPYVDLLAERGIPHTVLAERGPVDLRLVAELRALFARWQPDIVQTHGYKATALVATLRRLGARWPWVGVFHGATTENWKVRAYHELDRRLLGRADRVVVMSDAERIAMQRRGTTARVIHNAVIPVAARAGASLPAAAEARCARRQAPLIGVIGRLSPEKGVDVFLHACADLTRRGIAFSAIVAGDGGERLELERLRTELGLDERVEFVGAVAAIELLYPRLDLLVIPSRSEGLPNVLLEAFRADVPVVATHVGAVPEVVDGGKSAIVVPPGDATALADGIVVGLETRADEHARIARRRVVDRLSVEQRARNHIALYEELVGCSQA